VAEDDRLAVAPVGEVDQGAVAGGDGVDGAGGGHGDILSGWESAAREGGVQAILKAVRVKD